MRHTRTLSMLMAAAGGIAALALASRTDSPELPRALGWAVLAAVAASLALGTLGRRVLGAFLVVLGLGLAVPLEHPGITAGGVAVVLAGALMLALAGRWHTTRRFERDAPVAATSDTDVWKAMDAGLDPTADEFGDNLAPQARMGVPAPSEIHQEDQ